MLSSLLEQFPPISQEENAAASVPTAEFSLKQALQKSGVPEWEMTFKVITTLPLFEKLDLERVPRGADIKKAYDEIYYYVVARNYKENQPTFFHHLAGTVFYETQTQQQIYGKDHGQKAFATLKLVQKTIAEIEKALVGSIFPVHVPILREHKATLKFHYNTLLAALRGLSDEKKEHIKRSQKFDIDQQLFLSIPHEEALWAISVHPQTPSPKKNVQEKKTPKSLTSPSRKSVSRLGAKRLFRDDSEGRHESSTSKRTYTERSTRARHILQSHQTTLPAEDFGISSHSRTFVTQFEQLVLTSSNSTNDSENIQPVVNTPQQLSPR